MAYGKGPIKTGKVIIDTPGKRKPVKPGRPEPKVLMEKNEGRMYAGGDPNFNERTGEYKNKKLKNGLLLVEKEVRNNKKFKARVLKPVKARTIDPSKKRKPVLPKRPGGR